MAAGRTTRRSVDGELRAADSGLWLEKIVEDKRPLCLLSSKRLEDNWHSGLLSPTKQRLSGVRLPVGRKWELCGNLVSAFQKADVM